MGRRALIRVSSLFKLSSVFTWGRRAPFSGIPARSGGVGALGGVGKGSLAISALAPLEA